jgi:hypothetical protein
MLRSVAGPILDRAAARLEPFHQSVERFARGRGWLLAAVPLAWLTAVVFSVPGLDVSDAARGHWRRYWTGVVQLKVDHPLADMGARYEAASNEAKRTFRITVPLVARLTRTGVRGAFLFNHLCAYLALVQLAWLAARLTGSRAAGAYTLLLVAGTYLGTASFKDLFGWFDSTTFAFLVTAAGAPSALATALGLVCGAFTDERALALAPAAMIVQVALARAEGRPAAAGRRTATVIAVVLVYAALRAALTVLAGIATPPPPLEWRELQRNLLRLAPALWSPLEGGWLLLAAAAVAARRVRSWAALGIGLYLLAYVAASLFVTDVTRSISPAFLFVLAALPFLRERLGPSRLRTLLLAGAVVSLLVPNVFVWVDTEWERNLLLHLLARHS